MRFARLLIPIALLTSAAAAQTLDCPGSASAGARCVRDRVREKLMDGDITTDSEIYRDVAAPPPVSPSLVAGQKQVPLPQSTAIAQVANNATDLKSTHSVDVSKPVAASIDLPLI